MSAPGFDDVPVESTRPSGPGAPSPESGVMRRESDDEADAPPWDVVRAYLDHGAHAERVEAYAAGSPAFAEVLAALRNDQEEDEEPGGVLLAFRR